MAEPVELVSNSQKFEKDEAQKTAGMVEGARESAPVKKSVTIASEAVVAEGKTQTDFEMKRIPFCFHSLDDKQRPRKSTSVSDCQNGEDYLEEYDDCRLTFLLLF